MKFGRNWTLKAAAFVASIVCAQFSVGSQFICELKSGVSATALAAKYNATLLDQSYNAPFFLFDAADSDQQGLISDPGVAWSQNDGDVANTDTEAKGGSIGAVGDPDAIYKLDSQMLTQINWSSTMAAAPGRRVRVAVLDTGVSRKQPALMKKVISAINLVEVGKFPEDRPDDENGNQGDSKDDVAGHGTMVAGLIAATAPRAELVIVRVADSDGISTAWRLIKGLTFAVMKNAEVANISLGSISEIPALSKVLNWTDDHGLLVVSPVGNNNASTALFPAKLDQVVSVAGIDAHDRKASFSNFDSVTYFAAPSEGISSLWWDGSVGVWSGTSFASPLVAAAIADGLRKTSSVEPGDLREMIRGTGPSLNALNPAYKGKLGNLLDWQNLESQIVHSDS